MDKIANRYARAIKDFISGEKETRQTLEELETFGEFLDGEKEHTELRILCGSAIFSSEKRNQVVEGLADSMKVSPTTKKILLMLSRVNRLMHTTKIAEALKFLLLDSQNIVPLRVESSEKLSSGEREAIQKKFKTVLGKEVEASFEQVPNLFGGIRVTAGGRSYDGTLSTRLATLQEKLVGGY